MEARQRLQAERALSCLMAALLPVIGHAVLMRPWLARLPLPALDAIAPTIPHLPPSSAAMVGAMPASDANSVLDNVQECDRQWAAHSRSDNVTGDKHDLVQGVD